MTSPVVSNEMYVILGATGHTGSIVANFLLSKGQKVCVIGRDPGRLQRFADKGAEAFTADMSDAAALTKAFSGARGGWQQTVGADLRGKTLGVLGLGHIGSEVARIGRTFGMNLITWSQNMTPQVAEAAGAILVSKNKLFDQADILTIHLVLSSRASEWHDGATGTATTRRGRNVREKRGKPRRGSCPSAGSAIRDGTRATTTSRSG